MLERLKRFKQQGGLTFSFIGLLYIFTIVCIIIITLCSCGKVSNAKEDTQQEAPNLKAPESTSIKVNLYERPQTGLYATKDLGSHVMYVTRPMVDDYLLEEMEKYHIEVIEIYFRKDEGDDQPIYEAEPPASAVFYFISSDGAGDIDISWRQTGEDEPLVSGIHLDNPRYVMKYMVASAYDNASAVDYLTIEDYTGGGMLCSGLKHSTFGIDELYINVVDIAKPDISF